VRGTLSALLFASILQGCLGGDPPELPPPPEPVNTGPARANAGTRPKECQVAMQLITTCKVSLEPTRISAVAECTSPSYLGDTELQAFLRCLGDAPACDQLVRCSGPVGTLTPATTPPTPPPTPSDAPPVPEPAPPSPTTGSG
jgi:hypothetical protein